MGQSDSQTVSQLFSHKVSQLVSQKVSQTVRQAKVSKQEMYLKLFSQTYLVLSPAANSISQ